MMHFSGEYYFEIVQILTYKDIFFWHHRRYEDSFGKQLVGHFVVDQQGRDRQVPPPADLKSFRYACEMLCRECE
jgi:hypothetical protein